MGIISDSPTIPVDDKAKSAPQNTAVGSGSRPTASTMKIESSAPMNGKTLGRDVAGSLK